MTLYRLFGSLGLALALSFTFISCTDSKLTEKVQPAPGPVETAEAAETQNSTGTQQVLTLENGLEILLISDPAMQKAAAAMAVPSGSWADPEEHQGLAHYLEHMLFLGTRDFPVAGEYSQFLKSNGGYSNAYTARELTNYFFEVNADAYEGAVHRFSQFFVAPTFDATFSEREKNAVHSEFDKNIQSDSWRFYQLSSLFLPEGHPERKFNIGSLETLKNVTPSLLVDFYEKHYSADTMKLVLMGPHDMAELRSLAKKYFAEVPNRELAKKEASPEPAPAQGGFRVDMKTFAEDNSLLFQFPVPTFAQQWKHQPDLYLKTLLGDKGEDSLFQKLKKAQWVTDLYVYAYDVASFGDPQSGRVFIVIKLTEKGTQKTDEIAAELFSYIGMLQRQGVQTHILEDEKVLAQIAFDNRGVIEGADEAARYSSLMTIAPPLEINQRQFLVTEPSEEAVMSYLKKLTPENVNIYREDTSVIGDSVEPVYGTEYSSARHSESWLRKMKEARQTDPTGVRYPSANPHVPTDFTLLKDDPSAEPRLLSNNEQGQLWFQQETSASTKPLGSSIIKIYSAAPTRSARGAALNMVFAKAFELSRDARLHPMKKAGYDFKVAPALSGWEVSVSGYSEALAQLTTDVLASTDSPLHQVSLSAELLISIKESVQDELAKSHFEGAVYRASALSKLINNTLGFKTEEIEAEVSSIDLDELKKFAESFFSEIYIEALAYGNLKRSSYSDLVSEIFEAQGSRPLSPQLLAQIKGRELSPPPGVQVAARMTGEDNNNAVLMRVDTGLRTPKSTALNSLAGMLLGPAFYTEMRSTQQLGYIVQASDSSKRERNEFILLIQSAGYTADDLAQRMHKFVSSWIPKAMPQVDEKIEALKRSLVAKLSQTPSNMDTRFEDLKNHLDLRQADWEWKQKVIAATQEVSADDLKSHIEEFLTPASQARITAYYHKKDSPAPPLVPGEIEVNGSADLIQIIEADKVQE